MRQFLRETGELYYWAMFCPSKLQARMNAWQPREEEGTRRLDTQAWDILFLRCHLRFLMQLIILIVFWAMPLGVLMTFTGQNIDFLSIPPILIIAYLASNIFLSLGINTPLLFLVIYATQPQILRHAVNTMTNMVPDTASLALGGGIIIAGICLSATSGYWLARCRLDGLVNKVTSILLTLGVTLGGLVASQDLFFTFVLSVFSVNWAVKHPIFMINPKEKRGVLFLSFPINMIVSIILFSASLLTLFGFFWGFNLLLFSGIFRFLLSVSFVLVVDIALWSIYIMVAIMLLFIVYGGVRWGTAGDDLQSVNAGKGIILNSIIGLVIAALSVIIVQIIRLILFSFSGSPSSYISQNTFAESFILQIILVKSFYLHWFSLVLLGYLAGFVFAPTRYHWIGLFTALIVVVLAFGQYNWWAFAITCATFVGFYRIIPDYLVFALDIFRRILLSRSTLYKIALKDLQDLPPYTGEILWLPLPGHSRILAAAFRADAEAALATLDQMRTARYPGFRRTVQRAIPLMTLEQLHQVESVAALVAIASPDHPVLPRLIPALVRTADEEAGDEAPALLAVTMDAATLDVLYRLRDIARSVKANLGAGSAYLRQRGLDDSLTKLARLQGQLPALGLPARHRTLAQQVLQQWLAVIEQEINQQQATAQGQVVNPFQSGNPLHANRAELFKGRQQFADDIARQVLDRSRPTLLLHGPRRCGKSSFLLNLPRILPIKDILPVYIDLQSAASTSSEADFCYALVRAMGRDLRSQEIATPSAQRGAFRSSPYTALEDWLDQVVPRMGERRVLLCLDEFEKLGSAIQEGKLPLTIFDELRHLIQHRDELGFLFCGAQTLDELGPNWSSYFISVRPIEMTYLEPDEARELLIAPDPEFDLRYADGIVEHVLRETRCQPYLLQLMGEAMVTQANLHHAHVVTGALLEAAVATALKTGTFYFTNVWTEDTGTTPDEVQAGQTILHALAHGKPLPAVSDSASEAALHRLTRYHIVEQIDGGYRCEVPLVARWVRERAVL